VLHFLLDAFIKRDARRRTIENGLARFTRISTRTRGALIVPTGVTVKAESEKEKAVSSSSHQKKTEGVSRSGENQK
jgi:hypothetical protein